MSRLEEELHDALTQEAAAVTPSRDLFARVRVSVDEARRRRRRRLVLVPVLALAAAGVIALLVWGMTLAPHAQFTTVPRPTTGGRMSWWILELGTTLALVALAVWLGPFIKRFGRAYAADVFHDNPLTGKSYIVLTDVVYYLIFSAYILATVHVEPDPSWSMSEVVMTYDVTGAQIEDEFTRVAGILLIIGILHGLNIVLMPVLGRIFSLNRRLTRPTTTAPSEREAIDR